MEIDHTQLLIPSHVKNEPLEDPFLSLTKGLVSGCHGYIYVVCDRSFIFYFCYQIICIAGSSITTPHHPYHPSPPSPPSPSLTIPHHPSPPLTIPHHPSPPLTTLTIPTIPHHSSPSLTIPHHPHHPHQPSPSLTTLINPHHPSPPSPPSPTLTIHLHPSPSLTTLTTPHHPSPSLTTPHHPSPSSLTTHQPSPLVLLRIVFPHSTTSCSSPISPVDFGSDSSLGYWGIPVLFPW